MDTSRDLWWEARQKSRGSQVINLVKTVIQSLPGQPTRATFAALPSLVGRQNPALGIDLNLYRAGRDLEKFVDAGVDFFVLRMGGPSYWVEGDYRYKEDVTWRPYMEQLAKLGMLDRTIGYIIHNPFEDWHLENNVHVDLINQWTGGGYMPASFCTDHEVAECYRGANKITCTPYNLVNSLAAVTDKIYKKWRRTSSIYTARWFINNYALADHTTYLDNVNKPADAGGPGKQRPMWYAWLPQQFTKEYVNLETTLEELILPNADQTAKFLQCGSYSIADLWQYSWTVKLPGDSTGVDASVSMGTKDQCFAMFGLKESSTPPVEPPPPPVDPTIEGRVKSLEDAVWTLKEDRVKNITVQIERGA